MDPENRRKVWEILLELRKHKTVLLTTHFLEEADVLGDTIAIMYDGKIKCCGSTMFLKNLYNVGYQLRLQLSKEILESKLLSLIKLHVPEAVFEKKQANEYFFRLISTNKNEEAQNLNLLIAGLLDHFENPDIKQKFSIETYGLTNTTLEDVFIKIGTLDLPKENVIKIENAEDHPLHNLQRLNGSILYLQQFSAIMSKKFKLTYRNLSLFIQFLYILLVPLLIIFLLKFSMEHLFSNQSLTVKTFNIKEKFPGKELLILKNSNGDPETDLFRNENHGWLEKEFKFKLTQSKYTNLSEAVSSEINRLGPSKALVDLFLIPERINETSYNLYIDSNLYPFSLVGTIELFYRLLAREVDQDFDINLKFNFIQKSYSSDKHSSALFKDEKITASILSSSIFIGIVASAFVSIMFSFPFVSFHEFILDEMGSGVSCSLKIFHLFIRF